MDQIPIELQKLVWSYTLNFHNWSDWYLMVHCFRQLCKSQNLPVPRSSGFTLPFCVILLLNKSCFRKLRLKLFKQLCFAGRIQELEWLGEKNIQIRRAKATNIFVKVCLYGHLNVLQWLVDYFRLKDNLLAQSSCLASAIQNACCRNHLHVAEWIVDHFKVPTHIATQCSMDLAMKSALVDVCNTSHFQAVKWIADRFGVAHYTLWQKIEAFYAACAVGNVNMVQWLDPVLFPDQDSYDNYANYAITIFNEACSLGHLHVCQWLANRFQLTRLNLIQQRYPCITLESACALQGDRLDLVAWFIHHFQLPEPSESYRPFLLACLHGNSKIVGFLIDQFHLTPLRHRGLFTYGIVCARKNHHTQLQLTLGALLDRSFKSLKNLRPPTVYERIWTGLAFLMTEPTPFLTKWLTQTCDSKYVEEWLFNLVLPSAADAISKTEKQEQYKCEFLHQHDLATLQDKIQEMKIQPEPRYNQALPCQMSSLGDFFSGRHSYMSFHSHMSFWLNKGDILARTAINSSLRHDTKIQRTIDYQPFVVCPNTQVNLSFLPHPNEWLRCHLKDMVQEQGNYGQVSRMCQVAISRGDISFAHWVLKSISSTYKRHL